MDFLKKMGPRKNWKTFAISVVIAVSEKSQYVTDRSVEVIK